MSSRVRVLNISHVLPDQDQAAIHAPQPLPDDDGIVKLSFMDALFVDRVNPMRRLFFYDGPTVPPFPLLVQSLRSSLAATLAFFPPLTGKLAYRAVTGDVIIDCSSEALGPGVRFVEAEYDGSVGDMRCVAAGDEAGNNPEALKQFGPELDAGSLPAPVLVVQVTRPAVGEERTVMVGVRGVERWLETPNAVPKEMFTVTASSNRFTAYETDFGWGAPSRVELVSLFAKELVMILGAADGGVQVTVTLGSDHVASFEANLLRSLGSGIEA